MQATAGVADGLPNGFTKAQLAAAISPRIQELIILPTEKCNFRCTYCYEDFELGKMSDRTQLAVERLIERRLPKLLQLRFSWFGGEPLVAKDVVLRLSRFAKGRCQERGIRFDGGITTNAYLLRYDLAEELLSLNQNFFQVTLDGHGVAHDNVRRRADGRGTFDKIWFNLKRMKALTGSFQVVMRIHVRRENQENLEVLMREIAREFRGDRRFSLDFQHLRDMGGAGGKTINDGVTRDELFGIERHLRKIFLESGAAPVNAAPATDVARIQMPDIPINGGESAGGQRPDERNASEPYICYAARPNSLLIRSNGRIGKCTVAFDDERNDLGKVEDDGTITVDNEKLTPWIRGLGSLDVGDTGCPIQNMARSSKSFRGISVVSA